MSRVTKELFHPQDYASDAVVLRLCSSTTIQKLISYDSLDTRNSAVTIVTLVMLRMRVFAVNSRILNWRTRAAMSCISTAWFLSFHTSTDKSNPHTMVPNKRNMLIETLSFMFLVSQSDVTQSRRITSEPNEHTCGCWRVMLPDFTIEQLIGIVDKNKIRFDAIFGSGLMTAQSSCTLRVTWELFVSLLSH
jgi:hypothetical protein